MPVSLEDMSPDEINSLALLARSMRDNPETRKTFLQTVKKANPNLSIPEIDVENASAAQLAARDKEIAELREKQQAFEQQQSAQARISALKEDGVVRNANEFNEVVKYAAENGFQVNDAGLKRAAEARRREMEAATPTPTHAMQRPAIGNKDLMKNPQNWAREEASRVMDELIKQRRSA